MHVRNETSRYDIAIAAFRKLGLSNIIPFEESEHLIAKYRIKIQQNTNYIITNGIDNPSIDEWIWPAARNTKRTAEEDWHGQTN